MRQPRSTYRLQITRDFDLDDAAAIVDYVRALGADWLYLSPILSAEPGSTHGYDVIDHSTVDASRGGPEGLDRLATAAHAAGLGILVDIVPNHLGIATPVHNRWWWDVLMYGQQSRYAEAFDIDWEFGNGRVRVPILGDEPDPALEVVGDELRYYEHRFPLRPDSPRGSSPAEVHAAQHYELMNWRRADAELNYRRFFAINTLAGVRVEVPWVFEESHAEIGRWIGAGLVDGLRVDHPDGLADPRGYLDDLARLTNGSYVLVEKILEGDEHLPASWATAGTTGYDALADIDRVFVDPAARAVLNRVDARRWHNEPVPAWADLIHDTKRRVADGMLRSEVVRIERDVRRSGTDVTNTNTEDAIAELLACFPIYRSYLPEGLDALTTAAELAVRHRPDLQAAIDSLVPLLSDPSEPAAVRFQQTSGMVMAKGVEDCAFYRYNRLWSLTEVGGDPSEFAIDAAEFHRRQQSRLASLPGSMTTLTTHDTKQSEDVRARINTLAEVPDEWGAALIALDSINPLPDEPLAELLWQAIIGCWPASPERLHEYATKAAREAGLSTSWTKPDEAFEAALHAFVDAAVSNPEVDRVIRGMLERIEHAGWSNSLSAKLVQLTAPGVPDVYQGNELWDLSLVDPDNRRPVDFPERRRLLEVIDHGELPPVDSSGAAKLLVTTRALHLRRDHPELFERYIPLAAHGSAAGHVVAFDRGGAVTVCTRLPIGLAGEGGWSDTAITLASRPVRDVITGRCYEGGTIEIARLLDVYPVALLATEAGPSS